MRNWVWGFGFCLVSMVVGLLIGKELASTSVPQKLMLASAAQVSDSQAQTSCDELGIIHARQIEGLRNEVFQLSQFVLNDDFGESSIDKASGSTSKNPNSKNKDEMGSEYYEDALELVQNAEQYNEWTNQDAEDLRLAFIKLNKNERYEIMRRLSVAVNKGRLQPQTERFPF